MHHDPAASPLPVTTGPCSRSCATCRCSRAHDEAPAPVRTGRALVRWVEAVAHAAVLPSAA